MASDKPGPNWRNMAIWGAVGAASFSTFVLGFALLRDGGATLIRSEAVAAKLGLVLIFVVAVFGFGLRNRPVSWRNLLNTVLSSAVAAGACLLLMRGFRAFGGHAWVGMDASETVAAWVGFALLVLAVLGALLTTTVGMRAAMVDAEAAEDLRLRRREYLYSWMVVAAMGLALMLLSFAGPGGPLSPAVALAGAMVLVAVSTVLTLALWKLMDELMRRLSDEAGNLAFYLIFLVGGGWAMLAHLGFARTPAPLDWLTMFTVFTFVAGIIATARRGLFQR